MKQVLAILIIALSAFVQTAHAQTSVIKQDMFADMTNSDKAAVIAVHIGTTDRTERNNVLEKFNIALRKSFPEHQFHEAWTSRSVIRTVNASGDAVPTPPQLLRELKNLGYTHILIQPSFITDGMEMQNLENEIEKLKGLFKQIRIGEPLLTNAKDYELAVLAAAAKYGNEKTGNAIICNNTESGTNTSFTMLDYTLRKLELNNWYVYTINGVPTKVDLTRELKLRKGKKINLIPFIFPSGNMQPDNTVEQIKSELKNLGIKVDKTSDNIADSDEIIDLFISHAKHASQYRRLSPFEQKVMEVAQ